MWPLMQWMGSVDILCFAWLQIWLHPRWVHPVSFNPMAATWKNCKTLLITYGLGLKDSRKSVIMQRARQPNAIHFHPICNTTNAWQTKQIKQKHIPVVHFQICTIKNVNSIHVVHFLICTIKNVNSSNKKHYLGINVCIYVCILHCFVHLFVGTVRAT